ncbi:MAG TPA: PadR family transcriptional regulator [Solirubrobacteraceae bacterium]|jgi:PadR family transcriptional regulator AphA|nr:PadR family transcriptional regulator [Solirubrobacteraceae bacterium]
MTILSTRELAPGEWAVLGLLAEAPAHGFAISKALASGGEIGEIWALPRPLVYRALGLLRDRGLIRSVVTEAGQGPNRTILATTQAGLDELERWLEEPVAHVRDARSLLLLKLVYAERSGRDTRPLLERQRDLLRPVVESHRRQLAEATGWNRTIELWRSECMDAVLVFTEKLLALDPTD